jgi:4a-hydroxytetrahydrobiopterin dehydratase
MNPSEIQQNLSEIDHWKMESNSLIREFPFSDYASALRFVNEVGLLAESKQHHPSIQLDFDSVRIQLTTHDSGNTLTIKDFELAKAINKIVLQRSQH